MDDRGCNVAISMNTRPQTSAAQPKRPTSQHLGREIGEKALTAAVLFFVMFPILWLILTAFKPENEVYTTSFIFKPTLDNFITIFTEPFNNQRLVLNSLIIATTATLITVPVALGAAYVFSRYHFRGSQLLMVLVLVTQFIPPIVIALPFFNLFRRIGLYDSHAGLVIVYLSIVVPYAIWMLKGFIDALPIEIEQAASVDGCTEIGILRHITLPLVMPGVITTAVFAFIMCWNEFTYALILTRNDARTLQLGLMSTVGVRGILWELMAATGLIVMIPVFILSFSVRKYFVQGLTMGAVK